MREIGGYFGLELGGYSPVHDGIFVNSGRNALRYIIRCLGIKKLHVPNYTCPVVWQAIEAEGCSIEPYDLDDGFMPTKRFGKDDFIVYNNYFGVMGKNVAEMASVYPNLIVDNAQAFYSKQIGRAAFYSPRKFFGLPDGGIVVFKDPNDDLHLPLETDISIDRVSHLVKRIEFGAEAGYQDFKSSSKAISELSVKSVSKLTLGLMGSINTVSAAEKRRRNFEYLQEHLPTSFPLAMADDDVPMVYPYMTDDPSLRSRLIQQKIFVASYWPGVKYCGDLQERILPLPIDQRYEEEDMKRIVEASRDEDEVYLRPLTVDDAAVSWRWRNDAEIWKYTASRPNIKITEAIERDWARRVIANPTRANYAICLKPSQRYIGNIYLVNIKDGKGELGVFIGDKTCHGKGYARQAIEILKGLACRELGLHKILIGVNSSNVQALITYLKSGARYSSEGQWLNFFIDLPQFRAVTGGGVIVSCFDRLLLAA